MSELPYRPEHVNDAIADSEELTNEELGAFVRLQRALWRAGGYLPDDTKKLARFSRAGRRWGAIAPAIMAKLTIAAGQVSCPEILFALFAARERRAEAVDKAVRAAGKRWGNSGSDVTSAHTSDGGLNSSKYLKVNDQVMLGASSKQCLSNANQNQNYIDNNNLSVSGAAAGRRGAVVDNLMNATLYREGVELLMTRVGLRALAARSQISKWLMSAGDADTLANILAAADSENLRGPNFVAVVDQRVVAIEQGPCLPLGMTAVKGGRP